MRFYSAGIPTCSDGGVGYDLHSAWLLGRSEVAKRGCVSVSSCGPEGNKGRINFKWIDGIKDRCGITTPL